MKVVVVIPTIQGRESHLERCLGSYANTSPEVSAYVEPDHPSCGAGWLAGARQAERLGFDYLHFSADDLEAHNGWLPVAIETVKAGMVPAPLVFNSDGSLDSAGLENLGQYRGPYTDWQIVEGTTVPFVSREMWEAFLTLEGFEDLLGATHYTTDLQISAAARAHGRPTVIRTAMRFTHHTAPQGRNYGRVADDTRRFIDWQAAICAF